MRPWGVSFLAREVFHEQVRRAYIGGDVWKELRDTFIAGHNVYVHNVTLIVRSLLLGTISGDHLDPKTVPVV